MAELSTLARPYAKAAFEYARGAQRAGCQPGPEQLATAAAVSRDRSGHGRGALEQPRPDRRAAGAAR